MARKTRTAISIVLSALLLFSMLPAPALAKMPEEALGEESVAAAEPLLEP